MIEFENMSYGDAEEKADTFCYLAQDGGPDLLLKIGFRQDKKEPEVFYAFGKGFCFVVDTYKKTSTAYEIDVKNRHPQDGDGREPWACEFSWR